MKTLEQDGYKYSRKEFKGYKFRAMFRLSQGEDWRNDVVINIYTNNPDKNAVKEVINSKKKETVTHIELEHWTTKEQDDLTSQFIEESFKNI